MLRIRGAVVAYDTSAVLLVDHEMPRVLASCLEDDWPDELKSCIAGATPDALVSQHACDKLVTPDLRAKVARRFGVAPAQVQSMLAP